MGLGWCVVVVCVVVLLLLCVVVVCCRCVLLVCVVVLCCVVLCFVVVFCVVLCCVVFCVVLCCVVLWCGVVVVVQMNKETACLSRLVPTCSNSKATQVLQMAESVRDLTYSDRSLVSDKLVNQPLYEEKGKEANHPQSSTALSIA